MLETVRALSLQKWKTMKKNLIFLILIPLMFACSQQPNEGVVITGLIENYDSDVFQVGGPGGSRDSVMLDETGNFTYENSEITDADNYYLLIGNDVVYIYLNSGMERGLGEGCGVRCVCVCVCVLCVCVCGGGG